MDKVFKNERKVVISVVIPCFNCASTIIDTIKSVENNVTNQYEIVLINDGSADNTEETIDKYIIDKTFRYTYCKQINKGVSAARNLGIKQSKGEYIIFLDADDLLAPNYIDAIVKLYEEGNRPDTYACYRTTDIKKVVPVGDIKSHIVYSTPLSLLERYTYDKTKLGFTSFAYKKSILDEKKIIFPAGIKYGEDFEFATKFLANCENSIEIDYYCYYYRILENSVSRTVHYNQIDAIAAAENADKYLQSISHVFFNEFHDYMVHRAIFSCVHRFSKSRKKELLSRLQEEYDIRNSAKKLLKNIKVDKKTKLACCLYLISDKLFYFLVRR